VRLVACQPQTRALSFYRKAGWQSVELPSEWQAPSAKRSEKIIVRQNKTIPVHQLTGSHA
jgi:hypothetical protein